LVATFPGDREAFVTLSLRSDTDSITFEDVLAALASIADAMMLVRAVGDEAVSELIFIPAIPCSYRPWTLR
jgi:hypothetical protein